VEKVASVRFPFWQATVSQLETVTLYYAMIVPSSEAGDISPVEIGPDEIGPANRPGLFVGASLPGLYYVVMTNRPGLFVLTT
jgi:hypothetical protein